MRRCSLALGVPHGEATSDLTYPQSGLEGCASSPLLYPREFSDDVLRVARPCVGGIILAHGRGRIPI